MEQEIILESEPLRITSSGGDIPLYDSTGQNTDGAMTQKATTDALNTKQNTLTAGNNIQINGNTISATDTTYTAGTGIDITGNVISATGGGSGGTSDFNDLINRPSYDGSRMTGNTSIPKVPAKTSELTNNSGFQTSSEVATAVNTAVAAETSARQSADTILQSNITAEATARQFQDTSLQSQIDALVASSDVKDIVGTYAALQAYNTSTLGNNDIIKVLQDEHEDNATTYYRWSTSSSSFTLIGEEGPYYTKSATDTLLNAKANQTDLTALSTTVGTNSSNIASLSTAKADKSTTYTKTEVDTELATKQNTLTAGSNIQISGSTISATDTTYSAFTGTNGTTAGTSGLVPAPATTDAGKYLKADGTWGEPSGGGGGGGTSYTAGDGININSDVISVDTTTIQPKLTAGSNITITGNEISATDTTYSTFTGTNGTTAGTTGLVPAPATTDAGKYLKADGTWGEAGGGGGEIIELTSSDYDWPTSSPDGIALWLLDPGTYHIASSASLYITTSIKQAAYSGGYAVVFEKGGYVQLVTNQGVLSSHTQTTTGGYMATTGKVVNVTNNLGTSTSEVMNQNATTNMVYADTSRYSIKIGTDASVPSSGSVRGEVALGYTAKVTAAMGVAIGRYSRAAGQSVGIGGGANNGQGAEATGTASVSIGFDTTASAMGSVAIGAGALAATQGEVNIGVSTSEGSYYGYDGSNYRLLTGLYDPQSAHDAATKGYVDTAVAPLTGTTAPDTATVGTVGKMYVDTTNQNAYICVGADTVTPSYTWKQITS